LFILKTDVEKFTSPYKKTLHLIFKILALYKSFNYLLTYLQCVICMTGM